MTGSPIRSSVRSNPTDAAWAFVLSRSSQIDRLAARFFRALSTEDRADARADYITRIVEQHPKLRLDDARSAEMVTVTWLGWQARAVQQTYCRQYRRHEAKRDRDVVVVGIIVEDGRTSRELAATDGDGTPEAMDAAVEAAEAQEIVERMYAAATLKQREAMVAILLDLTPQEVRARYHTTAHACAERLEQFATQTKHDAVFG